MLFEKVKNLVGTEEMLLELISKEVQANYFELQNACYFLKLGKAEDKKSQIVWVRQFEDDYKLGDFYYESEFHRASIMIKFEKGRYDVLCRGHHLFSRFEVWPSHVTNGYPFEISDTEESRLIPRELLRGFAEITEALSEAKRNKAS